jgi:ABC-type oligopeptide transport system ATPase subunit
MKKQVQQLQKHLNNTRNLMSKHVQEMLEELGKKNDVINKGEITVKGAKVPR